ncbi:TPA: gamma-glutamyl-gamma-aminobutyrate hydrolase family protein [Streptococcus pneumoniae]
MKKPVIGITGNEKAHPDDDIMMSYAAKGFVEGVKDAGGIPIILPIGDQEMACHYISLIDKLILTGGQMGGTLYQDIEDHWQDSSVEYTTQRLVTEPDTVLQEIYGEISHINSFHHQSIKDLAPNLKVVAHDPKDGIIEAVMSTDDVAFLGVQWHPELLFENRPKDKKLFDYVVNEL